jgi:hypothetical protein
VRGSSTRLHLLCEADRLMVTNRSASPIALGNVHKAHQHRGRRRQVWRQRQDRVRELRRGQDSGWAGDGEALRGGRAANGAGSLKCVRCKAKAARLVVLPPL